MFTNNSRKRLISRGAAGLFVAALFSLTLAGPAGAVSINNNADHLWGGYAIGNGVNANSIQNNTGLGGTDPREVAANVVNVILGFLGIIAVILILAGGFMWMTAAGNEDKTATAKKVMAAGAVGLVIVLASFGIARFVINALVEATA